MLEALSLLSIQYPSSQLDEALNTILAHALALYYLYLEGAVSSKAFDLVLD